MSIDLAGPVSSRTRALVLTICAAGVVGLTLGERALGSRIPLVTFYFLPLLVAAAFVPRWVIFVISIAMVAEREFFGPLPWDQGAPERIALSLVAFTGAALFAGELIRNRRALRRTEQEALARSGAEREARALVESSPAAVLTVDSEGRIAMANQAAARLLGFAPDSPEGAAVEDYVPLLAKLLRSRQTIPVMRTVIETNGRRRGGETFYAHLWVSLYEGTSGPRLAVIISDVTEQLRDREESGLRQLLTSSKIIAGAVSHEIRNLAAAASVLYGNLNDGRVARDNADFEALGRVIDSVLKLSSEELHDDEEVLAGVDIAELLEELRTIIASTFEEAGARLEWEAAPALPKVRADHSGLLQVFINLAQNSCRALKDRPGGRLRVTAYQLAQESVIVRFSDNGPGISPEDRIFQPLQSGASSTGMGLFISRAIIRTFGGELHHTQRSGECSFIIELAPIAVADTASV